jgi:hypothetical protein
MPALQKLMFKFSSRQRMKIRSGKPTGKIPAMQAIINSKYWKMKIRKM